MRLSDLPKELQAKVREQYPAKPASVKGPRTPAQELKLLKIRAQRETFTGSFEKLWKSCGGPALETEHLFHEVRKWRMDYVHRDTKTAIELDGGVYVQGRHSRAKGIQDACDKKNSAIQMGWDVFVLCTGIITEDRVRAIVEFVKQKNKNNE